LPVDVVVTAVVKAAVDVVDVAGDTFVVVVVVIAADEVVVVEAVVVVDEEQDANTSDVTMRTVSRIQITPLFI
jgi:NADH:ubiquinone oxidoreductase subunit K